MNQTEFTALVLPFKDKLYRMAKRLLVSSEEAEDAVQEVFLKLWKGKQRITVVFVIAADGSIKDAKARASHPVLEAEAIRVINALPKMIPGKFQGVIVNVPYSLPIIFQIQ